jgi:hypothetical protein
VPYSRARSLRLTSALRAPGFRLVSAAFG